MIVTMVKRRGETKAKEGERQANAKKMLMLYRVGYRRLSINRPSASSGLENK